MKIRTKHSWLILIIFVGFTLFQGINIYTDRSVGDMAALEKNGLYTYGLMGRVQASSYELHTTMDLKAAFDLWRDNKNQATLAVDEFLKSEFFTQQMYHSEELQSRYETTKAGWRTTIAKLDVLESSLEQYLSYPKNNNKGILYQLQDVGGQEVFEAYRAVNSGISALNIAFAEQYVHLVEDISVVSARRFRMNQLISIGFTVGILAAIILLTVMIIKSIGIEISKIETGIMKMKNKELSDRIEIKSGSEIAKLGDDVNDFTEALGLSLSELKGKSEDSIRTKESLIESVVETTSSAEQMKINLSSIIQEVSELNTNINDSTNSTTDNLERIENLSGKIDNQENSIRQSEQSVERISSTIRSVSSISRENVDQVEELVRSAEAGGEQLQLTTTTLSDVYNSITEINNIIGIIQNISAQTNILAMNAAIEAAHAGDSGRGFSVVADEIRKLAEASQNNSKNITENIKSITESITTANTAGIETRNKFMDIQRIVEATRDSFRKINSSTGELQSDNDLVKETMQSLIRDSREIKDTFSGVEQNSHSIEKELHSISRVSENVTGAISEVSNGLDVVVSAMIQITEISQDIDTISGHLDSMVNEFIID